MTIAWTAWGPTQPELPRRTRALLGDLLGTLTPAAATPITDARLPRPTLPASARDRLADALGADAVRTDDESRALHAGGQSYEEIVRRRQGDAGGAPDAVLLPGDAAQVSAVLRICTEERVAVVPW